MAGVAVIYDIPTKYVYLFTRIPHFNISLSDQIRSLTAVVQNDWGNFQWITKKKKKFVVTVTEGVFAICLPKKRVVLITYVEPKTNVFNPVRSYAFDWRTDRNPAYFDTDRGGTVNDIVYAQTILKTVSIGTTNKALNSAIYEGPVDDIALSQELDYIERTYGDYGNENAMHITADYFNNAGFAASASLYNEEWMTTYKNVATRYEYFSFVIGALRRLNFREFVMYSASNNRLTPVKLHDEPRSVQYRGEGYSLAARNSEYCRVIPDNWFEARYTELQQPITSQPLMASTFYQAGLNVPQQDDGFENSSYLISLQVTNIGCLSLTSSDAFAYYYRTPFGGFIRGLGDITASAVAAIDAPKQSFKSTTDFLFQVYEDNSEFDLETNSLTTLDIKGHIILAGMSLIINDDTSLNTVDKPLEGPEGTLSSVYSLDHTLDSFFIDDSAGFLVPVPGYSPGTWNNYDPHENQYGDDSTWFQINRSIVGKYTINGYTSSNEPYQTNIQFALGQNRVDTLGNPGTDFAYYTAAWATTNRVNDTFDVNLQVNINATAFSLGSFINTYPAIGATANVTVSGDLEYDADSWVMGYTDRFVEPRVLDHQQGYYIYNTLFGHSWISYLGVETGEIDYDATYVPDQYRNARYAVTRDFFNTSPVNSVSGINNASPIGEAPIRVAPWNTNFDYSERYMSTSYQYDAGEPGVYWADYIDGVSNFGSNNLVRSASHIHFKSASLGIQVSGPDNLILTIVSNEATNSITVNGANPPWYPTPQSQVSLFEQYYAFWDGLVEEYLSGGKDHPLTRWLGPDYTTYQSVVMPIVATAQAIPNTEQREAPYIVDPFFRSSFVAYIVDPSFALLGTCVWDRNFTQPYYRENTYGRFFGNYEEIRNLSLNSRKTELTTQERQQLTQLKEDREYFESNITVQTNNILSIQMMAHIEWTSSKAVNYVMVSQEIADQIRGI